MSGRFRSALRFLVKSLVKTGISVFALVAACVFYFNFAGIPQPVLRYILADKNQGGIAVIADSAKLRFLSGINLQGVSVYSKHVLGKPMFEASSVDVKLSFRKWIAGQVAIRSISVEDAVVRLKQAKSCPSSCQGGAHKLLSFDADVKNVRLYDMVLNKASCIVVFSDNNIYLRDITGSLSRDEITGRASGEISYNILKNIISCDMVSNIDPNAVTAFFSAFKLPYVVRLLNRFGFSGLPPRVEWKISTSIQKGGFLHLTGNFRMRDCSYRGVDFLRADGLFALDLADGDFTATLNELFVVRPEGIANVSFVAKPMRKCLEFRAVSSLNPMETARMVNVLTNFLARNVSFGGPATISADGVLDFRGKHTDTDFKAEIKADCVDVGKLKCNSGSFDIHMLGSSVALTNIEVSAYNGVVSGDIAIDVPEKGKRDAVPYQLNLKLNDADFDKLVKSYSAVDDQHEYEGNISARLTVSGVSGDDFLKKLQGDGSIRISDGRVFMLPVFGGLSVFMTKIIPGLGFVLSQNHAKADYEIKAGRVYTDDLVVEGSVLSLKGYGSYMLGGDINFDVQVKLLKGHTLGGKFFRALTYPISKLFEFKVRGPISDPNWYPENFSFDLLKKIGIVKKDVEE